MVGFHRARILQGQAPKDGARPGAKAYTMNSIFSGASVS
jgi:hypothetical protein